MDSKIKKTNRLYLFLSFIQALILFYSIHFFLKNKTEITFNQHELSGDVQHINSQIQKIKNVYLTLPDQFKSNESIKLKIDKFNFAIGQLNDLYTQTPQHSFFNNQLQLKAEFILLNNSGLEIVQKLKQNQYNSKNIEPLIVDQLKKYDHLQEQLLKTQKTFLDLNQITTSFVILISFFTLLSILQMTWSILLNQKNQLLLQQEKSQLSTLYKIINNMSEGVVVTNPYGFFTYYNQSAIDILGPDIKDLHYESSVQLLGFFDTHNQQIKKYDLPFISALKKETTADQEIKVINKKNPSGLYISASNGYFVDEKGNVSGTVVVMKNISHKKQLEELWQKEKETAIDSSKKKSDFLASMSHEIRTPMNGIIGISTLLAETPLTAEQKDFVGTIKRSAHALLSLINDILDHSKIESGKIELISKSFDLKFLCKDILENFKAQCEEKNIDLKLTLQTEKSSFYSADSNRIRQVLINLIGNAVKFTPHGHVELKVIQKKKTDDADQVEFHILDTGVGMEKTELQKLFQKYFQTKSGHQFGGTGLGLSISKQLVDIMGGQIQVESEPEKGTHFWFELTLPKSSEQELQKSEVSIKSHENVFSGHVLVAEDNLINQKVASNYLTKLGFTVDLVKNGAEALDIVQKNKYSAIFMDCQMPVMTGYESTEKIKTLMSKNLISKIPIIALTAEGTSGERKKCFQSGMDEFLNKPILFEDLVQVLAKYFVKNEDTTLINDEISKLKNFMVGDQLLLEILLEEFKSTTPDQLLLINQHVQKQNSSAISEICHALKSASAALGAVEFSNRAGIIENLSSNQNPNWIQIKAEIDFLNQELAMTIEKINLEIHKIKAEHLSKQSLDDNKKVS